MSHCMCHGNSFTTGNIDPARRQWIIATAGVGGILGMTALIPFVSSLLPSERALAAGAPVEVDIGRLQAGEMLVVEWRGKPVWILNRTPEMLAALKKSRTHAGRPRLPRRLTATGVRSQSHPFTGAGDARRHRHLHPSWLLSFQCFHTGRSRPWGRLARRISLPLPRFHLRFRRARVQEQARANQSGGTAAPISKRHPPAHRQR